IGGQAVDGFGGQGEQLAGTQAGAGKIKVGGQLGHGRRFTAGWKPIVPVPARACSPVGVVRWRTACQADGRRLAECLLVLLIPSFFVLTPMLSRLLALSALLLCLPVQALTIYKYVDQQ